VQERRLVRMQAAVAPGGKPGTPALFDVEHVNHWRVMVDLAHTRGDSIVAELWHPTAGTAVDADEMEAVVDAFRSAAEGASDAGFDGVELAASPDLPPGCRRQVIATLVSVWGVSRVALR
jgi:2,4-dienoyl-CoA reductase-like NADH-dependent reductase (Old Yellow Enzyme family)